MIAGGHTHPLLCTENLFSDIEEHFGLIKAMQFAPYIALIAVLIVVSIEHHTVMPALYPICYNVRNLN
jgi:hypothetical protein